MVTRGVHRKSYFKVCDLVQEKFYRGGEDLHLWWDKCQQRAREFSLWSTRKQLLSDIQSILNELEASHLTIYDPPDDRRVWEGQSEDTGVRALRFEDRFVIRRVILDSPASEAGLRAGDEILRIMDQPPKSLWQIQTWSGEYRIRRGETEFLVPLNARTVAVDGKPSVRSLSPNTSVLEITSFRGEFFDRESWIKLEENIRNIPQLIIDLRGNSGGNIVAGLRALSTFACKSERIGTLLQPRRKPIVAPPLPDDLDDMKQLEFMERYPSIPLMTFSDYGCYKGKVTILIDNQTASVSEIFAQYFLGHSRFRVWGQLSAGDVLIATWYNLRLLGAGYSLSIPEAVYTNINGDVLEQSGIWPEKELWYDIEDALQGKDTWIERAR